MHHIISDGWSMGILMRELSEVYAAIVEGRYPTLPVLELAYTDFTLWQRRYLSGDILDQQLRYWTEQLRGAPVILDLPLDHPRQPVQTYVKGIFPFVIPAETLALLNQLHRQQGVTLFMSLLSTLNCLFFSYSGQTDISIGGLVANRHHAEIEPLVGFFVNTLVFRNVFTSDTSLKDLLKQVQTTTLDAYAHQDLPFEHLVDALNLPRSLSHSPLFQVLLVVQHASNLSAPTFKNLTVELENSVDPSKLNSPGREIGTFDLTLNVTETNDCIIGHWEYNRELISDNLLASMHQQFITLLSMLTNNLDSKLIEFYQPWHPPYLSDQLDNQPIKYRGVRIEAERIIDSLLTYHGVHHAQIILRDNEDGIKEPVALVTGDPATLCAFELKNYLASLIPDYMVPKDVFIIADKFCNEPIDHESLTHANNIAHHQNPATATEIIVANLWSSLLSTEHISIYDNFFLLGGHSLLATQMMAHLEHRFKVPLPLQMMFEAQTLKQFSARIDQILSNRGLEGLNKKQINLWND
jgi:acyl carrier protein